MRTLVIGASTKPERYSFKAINALLKHGHETLALSVKKGSVNGVEFMNGFPELDDIDTVTLYIGPKIQPNYYEYLVQLKPRRVIFNPGTENLEFQELLRKGNIEVIEACTLVMLSIGNY